MASLLKQYHSDLDQQLMNMKSNKMEDRLEARNWDCERLTCFILRLLDVDETKIHRRELDEQLRLVARRIHTMKRTSPEISRSDREMWDEISGLQQPYMDVVHSSDVECRLYLNL